LSLRRAGRVNLAFTVSRDRPRVADRMSYSRCDISLLSSQNAAQRRYIAVIGMRIRRAVWT